MRLMLLIIYLEKHVSVMSLALMVAFVGISLRFYYDFEHIPNLVPIESVKNKYFDYIIIGAGELNPSVNLRNPQK
jgi:hypothetical protein